MKLHAVTKSILTIAIAAVIVAASANSLVAKIQAAPQISAVQAQIAFPSYFPLLDDFDGDLRLDQAEVHSVGAHHCIRVRFGNSRECHLESGVSLLERGALLARDINHDNNSDLLWVSHSRSEPPEVWLGDGLGNFEKAPDKTAYESDLGSLLFGEANSQIVGGSGAGEEEAYLAPDPESSEFLRATNVEADKAALLVIAGCERRRDLGLDLSYLRERGPPLHTSLV
ncbi:MAG TPA: hypothetical protein VNS63_05515 [Blastocatellia bacterium]|nr:hypothetical protein [Blastocatellia bacterium]